jgi:hypothetical protein
MSTSKAITKLLSQYVEDFIKSCPSDNKEGILKEMMSKESTKKFQEFIKTNEIKKKKTEKDSSIPRKPKNSYMVFCDKYRPIVVQENRDKNSKDITVILGEKWTALKLKNDEEYKEIENQSKLNKTIYDEKMKKYRTDNNIEEKTSFRTKDAFYYFQLEQKKDLAGLSNKEINSNLRKQWKKLNEEKNEIVKKYLQIATNNFEIKKDDSVNTSESSSSPGTEDPEDTVVSEDKTDSVVEKKLEKKKAKKTKKVSEKVDENETLVSS